MIRLGRALLLALAFFSTAQARAGLGASLPGEIKEFSMSACRVDHTICFHVQAPSAEGAQLKRLFVLDNVQLELNDQKTGKKTVESWSKAYVDLELNRLVVWNIKAGARTEKIFDF